MPATTKDFYPRPPRGGRRSQAGPAWYSRQDFYPRPPRGGRPKEQRTKATPPNFYPRPPRGGRHRNYVAPRLTELFLSTPSARRATAGLPRRHGRHPISIHALREEGDHPATERPRSVCNFYPRPPRGGRRYETALRALKWLFLSTPSARRATFLPCSVCRRLCDFYPRPPRGGRLPCIETLLCVASISIHALREEGDKTHSKVLRQDANFYPRPPRGGRLLRVWAASRFGSDFYPRPPRGGRPSCVFFQQLLDLISIHALREEGDLSESR